MFAPSAHNREPWYFVVIKDKNIFRRIMEMHPYASMLKTAPAAVLVCADTNRQPESGYYAQDLSAVTQNMLLAASDLGIGSCWVGIFPKKQRVSAMKKLLGLDKSIVPFSLVVLGYSDEKPDAKHRFEKDRIMYEGGSK